MKKLLLLLLILGSANLFSLDPWYSQKKRGWYYYEEKEIEDDSPQEEIATDKTISFENAASVVEEEKEKTNNYLCLALLRPTPENVSNYLKQQKKLMDQSAKFASSWKGAILSNPNLAFGLPKTDYAQLLTKSQDRSEREARLAYIKKEHFMLFVFKGEELFSKEMASVLDSLSLQKGWVIQGVSMDGVGVEEFPNYEVNKGISDIVGIKSTPSIYLVHPEKNYILPIGNGLMDHETIEKNIDFQIQRKGDKNHVL